MLICGHCNKLKIEIEYYKSNKLKRGYQSWCIQCHKDNRIHDGQTKTGKLFQRYGITREELEDLRVEQNHKCKICKIDISRDISRTSRCYQNIDHNHATGKVRGILCFRCNAGIGLLNESPEQLRLAADYIEKDGNI